MVNLQTDSDVLATHSPVPVQKAARLVRALLSIEIERLRLGGHQVSEDPFRGLYISEDEVDRLLGGEGENDGEDEGGRRGEVLSAIHGLIERDPKLSRLRCAFGLTAAEAACVVLCWVSEVDGGVERLVAYSQDDVTKRRPRVDLILRLLADGLSEQSIFARGGNLRWFGILDLHEEPGQPQTPQMARSVILSERVAGFLSGSNEMDLELEQSGARLVRMGADDVLDLPAGLAARLRDVPGDLPPLIHGPDGAKLRQAAGMVMAPDTGLVLEVPLALSLAREGAADVNEAFQRSLREAVLQDSGLLLAGIDELSPLVRRRLEDLLRSRPPVVPIVVAAAGPVAWPGVELGIAAPEFDERVALWNGALPALIEPPVTGAIASRFRLYTEEIKKAAAAARGAALVRGDATPSEEDVFAAARSHSAPLLSDLATKVPQFYSWDDLILPADTVEPLRELCASVEYRHTVLETWGFRRKLSTGKGVIAMFVGESGTGKTMAADVAAGHLGLDLYKVDLSGVVSKYIGETEKNLKSVFAGAQRSNAILFFDEADALFGKRSEVKDAHDRYANIETAYLLQRMEQYEGVVILATNLRMNIDEAFLRRMHFVIDFPMPDEAMRERIWRTVLPADLPLAGDIDFPFLAKSFRLAGGNIRNIALGAAFLAAEEHSQVEMRHFVRSVRREYQKLGRMVTQSDFGPYWRFL